MFSDSEQDKQLAINENSKLTFYGGAGKGAHSEEPERFASDLLDFIKDD